jgi:N-acetylneuraminate synthase
MTEIIAELGINHNGDMDIAKRLIDMAAVAGCNYVKLQKRTIGLVYSPEELIKHVDSPWGTTGRDKVEGREFSFEEYDEIADYCRGKIDWFASPWDVESANFLSEFKTRFIKIPSARITNEELLRTCKKFKQQVILSTGMSTIHEVLKAVKILGKEKIYCIMHCTSTYPTKPTEINAKCIFSLKELFPWCRIGFSNHYPGLMAMLIAAAYGAEMLEFHFTLDRAMYGSDQAASIEPQGVLELVKRVKLVEEMRGNGIKEVFDSEIPIMAKLRR